ncbi:MAG: hypothetical protein ACP5QO_17000, partial [Clostridia bacterium]
MTSAKLDVLDQLAQTPRTRHTGSAPYPPSVSQAVFYGLAGDVVRTLGPASEADPMALLVQFLVAFGNAIGRGPFFIVEADPHYTNEMAVLVGETAKGRKGTSWGHIRSLFAEVDPEWVTERISQGLVSGEGLIWTVRDAQPGGNALVAPTDAG